MGWIAAAADYIGSYFVGSSAGAAAGTAAVGTAAEAAAVPTLETVTVTGAAEAGGVTAAQAAAAGAVGAGVAGAALSGSGGAAPAAVAPGAARAAQPGPAPGKSIATTVSEASAIATGASALYTLSQGAGRANVPPVPITPAPQVDQSVANAAAQELQRRQAVAGLQSTVGTGPGQAGAILNPATLSQASLLGA